MNRPSRQQDECARRISAALKIPLPSIKTKQSYWEFIRDYLELSKKAPAAYILNGERGQGEIILSFNKIPKHCGDCRLYLDSEWYDEDAFFGDGITKCCPFGASTLNCMNSRPKDCPIRITK